MFFFLFGFSGTLTEIHRVWITIDQKLYIWDYQTSASVITKETEQLIITVALCPPRRGVFKKEVKVSQPFVFFLVYFFSLPFFLGHVLVKASCSRHKPLLSYLKCSFEELSFEISVLSSYICLKTASCYFSSAFRSGVCSMWWRWPRQYTSTCMPIIKGSRVPV